MVVAITAIVVGLLVLVWSADRFVVGASGVAKYANVPPLLIGMIIVGFGTSMPELVVSATASLNGNSELALGNAVGSNIVNIGLILGLTALVAPIAVNSNIVKRELPILLLISVLFTLLIWDLTLTRVESCGLLAGFFALLAWSVYAARQGAADSLHVEIEQELSIQTMSLRSAILWTILGLLVLVASSRLLVWGAVSVAESLGVSSLVIGLTIVAFGTSFPELATSVVAARRGEHDIAIGNVVGSNMFNILMVVGVAGLIEPMTHISEGVIYRDMLMMLLLTVALIIVAYGFKRQGRINRLEGAVLVALYVGYTFYLLADVT
jgi:cation:H+ antiporter